MKYKYIGTEEQLISQGFKKFCKNNYYKEVHQENDNIMKAFHFIEIIDNKVLVTRFRRLNGSGYGGNMGEYNKTPIKNIKKHIKDLIDLGLVKEVKE